MNWLKLLFSESKEVSNMRVIVMLVTFTGCFIGIAGLFMNKDLSALSILCGTFISAGMAGKVFQKREEIK